MLPKHPGPKQQQQTSTVVWNGGKKERESLREIEQIKVVREWNEGDTYNNNLEDHWNITIIGLL